jgi:hypothetical protein
MASKMVPVKQEQIEFYLVRGHTMATAILLAATSLLGCGESWEIRHTGGGFLRMKSSVSIAKEANFYLNDTLWTRRALPFWQFDCAKSQF